MKVRGNKASGYRSTEPAECPACAHRFHMSGTVAQDREGPYLHYWPVARSADEYSDAELRHILHGPKPSATEMGVVLPKEPGRVRLPADPVPNFNGVD